MPEPSTLSEPATPAASAVVPHILVVDDEEMMRAMLSRELPRLGFRVTSTGSGEEGIHLTQTEDFAVAVVDMLMPGLDGMETLKRLPHESPAPEGVLLTGQGTTEGAVAGEAAGASDLFSRTFTLCA